MCLCYSKFCRFPHHGFVPFGALARLWPTMFAYQHIIEAEITTLDEEWTGGVASTPE